MADIRRRFIEATNKGIRVVRRNLQAVQSLQKKYADIHRTDLEFQVGDYVYLRVAARKGLQKVPRLWKLAPRYVGPFRIISRIGSRVDLAADESDLSPQRPVAYELDLPLQLAGLHPVFHVSMLRKAEVPESVTADYRDLEILTDAFIVERPVQILDRREQILRGKVIPLVRVLWSHHGVEESTWEREDVIREQYPEAFTNTRMIQISRTKYL